MIRLFTGYDKREAPGFYAFIQSLIDTSDGYRLMPPLTGKQEDGTTSFTYARFLVPELCNFGGFAIFVDACDMLLRAPIQDLWALRDQTKAVQVVKHDYVSTQDRKFIGTEMEAANPSYPRKNWSSVVIFNAGHMSNFKARNKIRNAVEAGDGKFLHRFGWLEDKEIGGLPVDWNWLCDEFGERKSAKLLHWTLGAPFFKHYANAPMSNHWHATAKTFHSER